VLDLYRKWPPEFTRLLTVCRPSWPADRQTAFQLVLLIVLYGLPLVIMAFAYVQIARRLWTSLAMEPVPDSPCEYLLTVAVRKWRGPASLWRLSEVSDGA
jgi:hypothetical protein